MANITRLKICCPISSTNSYRHETFGEYGMYPTYSQFFRDVPKYGNILEEQHLNCSAGLNCNIYLLLCVHIGVIVPRARLGGRMPPQTPDMLIV